MFPRSLTNFQSALVAVICLPAVLVACIPLAWLLRMPTVKALEIGAIGWALTTLFSLFLRRLFGQH